MPWAGFERALHKPTLEAARSQLDEAAWEEAWREGQAMILDEAVAHTLAEESGV